MRMTTTPEINIDEEFVLKPVNRRILPEVIEAHNEDPEGTLSALPWLTQMEDIHRQLADLLLELEHERDEDRLHFWAIHQGKDSKFVGMIGLGDELQLAASAYNLGYWVRSSCRRQNIANRAVDAVFDWVREKQDQALIEITVHPHNKAGLSTCQSICDRWQGLSIDGYVGIDLNGRTVPHQLYLIQLRPSEGN
ncbi:MAG: GNAT family N-acetyltransferase [Candidatus Poseidoniaceae archaeon]|jgi:RimJ/RimL family protein N-acetyltransferase